MATISLIDRFSVSTRPKFSVSSGTLPAIMHGSIASGSGSASPMVRSSVKPLDFGLGVLLLSAEFSSLDGVYGLDFLLRLLLPIKERSRGMSDGTQTRMI